MQIWLRGNPRSAVLPAALGVGSLGIGTVTLLVVSPASGWRLGLAFPLLGIGVLLLLAAWSLARAARIAFADGQVLLYIRPGTPQRIPLEFVEVFFFGQGEGATGVRNDDTVETANVIVRVADRATEYRDGPTSELLAHWCDGYITIFGTWCQKLDGDVVLQLNKRLTQAKRDAKARTA